MNLLDLLGHLAYVFILLGLWYIARGPQIRGWKFRVVGDFLWVIIGIKLNLSSVWFWSGIFLGIDCVGWMREARKK